MSRIRRNAAPIAVCVVGCLLLVVTQRIFSETVGGLAASVLFFGMVLTAGILGGWKSGLVAIASGLLCAVFLFFPSYYSRVIAHPIELLRLATFVFLGACLTVICELLQRAWRRIEERQRRLEEELKERRRSDSLERKNAEIFRLVHQIGKIGHWEWNSDTDENIWSPEIEALYGLGPGEFEGGYEGWAKLIHPDDLAEAEADVKTAMETGKYLSEFRVVWPDGSIHWLETRAHVVKNSHGTPARVIGVNMDITARKQQEDVLRVSENRWRTMAEALPNLVWTDLPDGQCDWLSSQWETYTGFAVADLLGTQWLDNVIHPDDRARTLACWELACADKGDYDLEYRIRRHDGEYHWFKTRGVPIRNDEGKIVYWFGTCTDIEDTRRLAESLSEADRRKDEFLATLAHELRNPLAPIRSGLEVLRLSEGDPATSAQARSMMERQLGQLVRLVDDLMDVSRINHGKLELRAETLNLETAIHSALETSRSLIEEMGQKVIIQMPEEPVFVKADRVRLSQIFMNLMTNSAKYSEPGKHIWVTVGRDQQDVRVSVRDEGIGLAPDHLPRIFELFSQVERSLGKSRGGLGIGLSLVKRLTEMHGGTIEAKSEGVGRGSEFIVRLPIFHDLKTVTVPEREDVPSVQLDLKILVVDDNRDGADSLSIILRAMGNQTRIAYDGAQAIEVAKEFHPDVILLDIGLPSLSGYEVCRRIRQLPGGQQIVIIAQTGWSAKEDRERTREAGFNLHLVKPIDPQALMTLLATLKMPNAIQNASS